MLKFGFNGWDKDDYTLILTNGNFFKLGHELRKKVGDAILDLVVYPLVVVQLAAGSVEAEFKPEIIAIFNYRPQHALDYLKKCSTDRYVMASRIVEDEIFMDRSDDDTGNWNYV